MLDWFGAVICVEPMFCARKARFAMYAKKRMRKTPITPHLGIGHTEAAAMSKLTASAISTFLKSPRLFYWRYVHELFPDQKYPGIEPLLPSVQTFDHDKLFGTIWGGFVTRFYQGDAGASERATKEWNDSWVPDKQKKQYGEALAGLMTQYYAQFSPDDGARLPGSSERRIENDRFAGYLDGMSDERIIHECKSTSRSPSLADQIWKVENSIQVKLYAVITGAKGICVEFAFKDPPYQVMRCPTRLLAKEQLSNWQCELECLADGIWETGSGVHAFPCHPDGCCILTKRFASMCPYQALCDEILGAIELFKARENDR